MARSILGQHSIWDPNLNIVTFTTLVTVTYGVMVSSQGQFDPLYVRGQGHRDGTLGFKGTEISPKLSHGKLYLYVCRHLLAHHIRGNN